MSASSSALRGRSSRSRRPWPQLPNSPFPKPANPACCSTARPSKPFVRISTCVDAAAADIRCGAPCHDGRCRRDHRCRPVRARASRSPNNVAVPNGVVMVSPSSTSPALTTIDDDDYFFRTAPSDARQGQIVADITFERGIDTVAITYTTTITVAACRKPSRRLSRNSAVRSLSTLRMKTVARITLRKLARSRLPVPMI